VSLVIGWTAVDRRAPIFHRLASRLPPNAQATKVPTSTWGRRTPKWAGPWLSAARPVPRWSPGRSSPSFLGQAIGSYRTGPGAPSWARSSSWSYRACSSADAERFETQRARFHFEVAAVRAQRVKALIACLLSMHLLKKNHRGDDRVPRFDVSSVSGSGRRPRESNRWFQRASLSLLVKSQEG